MRREYIGTHEPDAVKVVVLTNDAGKRCRAALSPRLDLARHSPTGFEWGYGGSGPAQLALAILADFFRGAEEETPLGLGTFAARLKARDPSFDYLEDKPTSIGDQLALRLHQDFKFAYVAGFRDPWTISSIEIGAWLATRIDFSPTVTL